MSDVRRSDDLVPDEAWGWTVRAYAKGEDPFWDRLDERWFRIDGALSDDGRLYVRWQRDDAGRYAVKGLLVDGPTVTADLLRSISIGRLEVIPKFLYPDVNTDGLAPLARQEGELPDRFAERVATYYRMFIQVTTTPAKAISEHSGVPVTTVRGWIREARLRGKLPPGTKGRAG